MSDRPIIVVKKKKVVRGGHHGGSWKVAYADFVTAMMAFFLVMWIMSMDEGVKDMVQGYFQNPVGFKRSFSGGRNPLSAGNFITDLDIKRTVIIHRREQEDRFERAAGQIREQLLAEGTLDGMDADVEMVISDDGLRIELMETGSGDSFFDRASAALKPTLRDVLRVVAKELDRVPGDVVIEGHTDAMPFGRRNYSNWELSAERANAARAALVDYGFPEARISEVRGYAHRRPKIAEDPMDPRNRRISVLLPFLEVDLESLTVVPGEEPRVGPDFGPATPASRDVGRVGEG